MTDVKVLAKLDNFFHYFIQLSSIRRTLDVYVLCLWFVLNLGEKQLMFSANGGRVHYKKKMQAITV